MSACHQKRSDEGSRAESAVSPQIANLLAMLSLRAGTARIKICLSAMDVREATVPGT
jgi:hypothetical protein